MGKHSKNAGVMGAEGLTYHERKALGFGTAKERLGKDSLGNFDDCRLTLRRAADPVCTPLGYIFSREAILENLLAQKKANKRKLAMWEAQQAADAAKAEDRAEIAREAELLAFDRVNHQGASAELADKLTAVIQEEADAALSNKKVTASAINIQDHADRIKELKAFWVPSASSEAETKLEKPSMHTLCPASGKRLALKDLLSITLTNAPDSETEYVDPVTRDVFTNASRLVVIRPTGMVVQWETWKNCILPDGQIDGVKVDAEDAIELKGGGTGFAAHDKDALAEKYFALGAGSGLADRRGQNASARSKFGLRY